MSDNEKRGNLVDGAATDEALASSPAVLWASRGGYRRGLQQFYTPAAASEFIAESLGFKPYRKRTDREWAYSSGRRVGVFDPTAGDGSLMAAFGDPCVKWGCEIDKDQIAAAGCDDRTSYHAIAGDIQRIVPLALSVGLAWPVVVTNPPFGLVWDVPGVAEGSSTYVGWKVADALLAPHGIGVLIAGRDRFDREIAEEMGDRAMVIVEVADLFPGVDLECVIVFWHKSPFRAAPRLRVGRVGDLAALAPRVHTMLGAPYLHGVEVSEVHSRVSAVADEYERRLGQRLHGQASTVEIRSGRLSVVPSAYQKINIVTKHGGVEALRWIESFHRQTPAYFAQRAKEWRKIREWADGEIITIDAAVGAAVQGALDKVQRLTVPLYPVEPAQRLGFLADADHITCKMGDADRGFTAGTVYPIACATQVLASKADRVKETLDGPEHYYVAVERKAMRITIGGHHFTEAPGDLQFVLDHFDVPDPGNIGDRYPEEILCYEAILRLVEMEIQEREPSFAFHRYQIADIARCCAQQGAVLAWEQGLGKALGGGAFMRALELLAELRAERETKGGRARIIARLATAGIDGAATIADHLPRLRAPGLPDGCALFAMPQDLTHPQFDGEMMRFFGRSLVRVASAAFDLRHPRPKRRKAGGDCTAAEVAAMVTARRADLAAQKRGVALAPRPPVWAITWFEALAVSGKTPESRRKLPEVVRSRYNRGRGQGYPLRIRFPSKQHCPHCLTDRDGGWDGEVCRAEVPAKRQAWMGVPPRGKSVGGAKKDDPTRRCGYVHRAELVKPAYAILAQIGFRAVMVDEGTKIKGDTSLASKAIRAFRAPYRLVATGTPLKNFVIDLFWLLWWALGDASARFPYAYEGGRARFLEDFGVVETKLSEWGGKAWDPAKGDKPPKERGAREKMLPEVSNLLQLWRMLCPSIARRRMEDVGCVVAESGAWTCKACGTTNHADVGAPYRRPDRLHCVCGATFAAIVPISFHPVRVPWGIEQRKLYAAWLVNRNFVNHFMAKHPDSPLMQSKDPDAVISLLAPGLGQLAKLEYATTDPIGDPDWGGPTIPGALRAVKPSPWTPGRVKMLEIAKAAALAGEQVLIGSCLVEPGPWIAERLREVGIAAAHITETDSDGNVSTMPPAERARIVADFRAGKIRVLCVGIAAVNLGHNLDTASVVICDGLPWDFATWDQFLKRARRLTSRRPVKVYPILPHDSLATTKWQRLADKTAAADLAMDGKLWAKDERPIDRAALLRELQERGARLTGDEVDEEMVRRLWYGIPEGGEQMALAI